MTKAKSVQCATTLHANEVLFSSSSDDLRVTDADLAYVFRLRVGSNEDKSLDYVWNDYDWTVVSVTNWQSHQIRCVLSREGQVNLYGPGGSPDSTWQIADAGVMRDDAPGYGYVNRIRAIGNSLYVCGQSRQVYRFQAGLPTVLDSEWLDFSPMRQSPIDEPPEDPDDLEAFDSWLDANNAIDLVDIAGSTEHDIYTTGDECWHFNGRQWRQLTLPTDEFINAIKVVNRDEVYLVGHNGTLLKGSAVTKFAELSSIEDNQNFTSVERFGDQLYLASNMGLFVYDPSTKKIHPAPSSLTPDLQDTRILEAKDGVLWSFGFKDIAYFDGETWTRVDHPDNPPIR